MNTFYLTTPIYYVNDKPHIGHAYTTILADVLTRFHRKTGEDVFFLTGLDEHGQKVQQAAENRGVDPIDHCDEMAPRFLELWKKLHIQNDDFIRTTEKRHVAVVQKILQDVFDSGDIYEDEYEGLYSISEERFITEKEAESGDFRDIKKIKEKNYFFKMSQYQQPLIDHINKNPKFIQPEHRKNEVLGFLKKPLGDLCISRPKSRLNWGIELPFDSNYVTYVWFDALINYITAVGYNVDEDSFNKYWPANYHLIGKDILRFHAVYWPAFLLAAKIELPKKVYGHGWILSGEEKMSKSKGNILDPLKIIEEYGLDPLRYYLVKEVSFGNDGNISQERLEDCINSDLANNYGNLCQRVTAFAMKNCDGKIPAKIDFQPDDLKILNKFQENLDTIRSKINEQNINFYIDFIVNSLFEANKYFNDQEPWKKKDNLIRLNTIVYTTLEIVRKISFLLYPIIPETSLKALKIFNLSEKDIKLETISNNEFIIKGNMINKIDILIKKIEKEND